MEKLSYQWSENLADTPKETMQIFEHLGFSSIMSKLIVQKGIHNVESAKKFFLPKVDQLYDPFLMKGMEEAVDRIAQAITNGQKILVYGDYDVDGTTSVALLFSFLEDLGISVSFYIPDREKEGYGISSLGINYAHQNNIKLIVALDCGIRSVELVQKAKNLSIDFVICDHHIPGAILPDASAILNPKQKGCNYPFKELSGCGIGFKLCQAIASRLRLDSSTYMDKIDLVAVSIAADLVEMNDENRVLTFLGMKKLSENPFGGLRLFRDLVIGNRPVKTHDLVFKIGPRINAAGRVFHANQSVKTLLYGGQEHFDKLNALNKERQELDQHVGKQALAMLSEDTKSTVVFQSDWHKGVIGIVASRILEHAYKPTVVLTEKSADILVGSARSIPNFNMYEGLNKCADLLEQFGGHYFAAGLSLKKNNLAAFKQRFEEVVSQTLIDIDFVPKAIYNSELKLEEITGKLAAEVEKLAPFGPKNMRPIFLIKQVENYQYQIIGKGNHHLRLEISHAGQKINCIAFQMAHHAQKLNLKVPFDLFFHLEINDFRGRKNVQLVVVDIKF